MSFFTFNLDRIKILDNREWGSAELKLISMMVPDYQCSTEQDIKDQTKCVTANKVLIEVNNIGDNHELVFGDTGYSLYRSFTVPTSLNWVMFLVELDQEVRDLGKRIDKTVNSVKFHIFAKGLLKLSGAVNPLIPVGAAVAKYFVSSVAEILQANQDDQIGVVYQSFNKYEHFTENRAVKNVSDLSGNIKVDYSIFKKCGKN